MKRIIYRWRRWVPLLLILLVCLIAAPVSANSQARQQRVVTTSLSANVYLPTEALKPIFQERINQQVRSLSESMVTGMVGSLPGADQGWFRGMAGALIQPSATLTRMVPQENGLAITVNLSMFPGDPRPVSAAMLVTFSVRDAATVQVSAQPMAGSPQLANGPLTTFTLPMGQLTAINAVSDCGAMALDANIQVPVTLNTGQASSQSQNDQVALVPQSALLTSQTLADGQQRQVAYTTQSRAANALDTYVEVSNSSLGAFGSAIGSLPIDSMWTAQNLRIRTQDKGLVIVSDISPLSTGVPLATATTYVQPGAENGKLVMHVTSTVVKIAVFTFPNDVFNQKIEAMLNGGLGNSLAENFTVNSVSVGDGAVPCASSDSLMLQGTTSLG